MIRGTCHTEEEGNKVPTVQIMMLNVPDIPAFTPTLHVIQLLKHIEFRWTEDSKFPIGTTALCMFRLVRYANHAGSRKKVVYVCDGGPPRHRLSLKIKKRHLHNNQSTVVDYRELRSCQGHQIWKAVRPRSTLADESM